MKTLIFADWHLGTENTEDKPRLLGMLEKACEETRPNKIIFAGDTFELILPLEHNESILGSTKEMIVHETLAQWDEVFRYLDQQEASEIIFLSGEHDFEITYHQLEGILQDRLRSKQVRTQEYSYDTDSRSLVMHGHQLDYNRIFLDTGGKKISCIDGLTRAINTFIHQAKHGDRLQKAVKEGNFSYWYAFSRLPAYIDAASQLFGADKKMYERAISAVLRGGELDKWLEQQRDWLTHVLGQSAKIIAVYPPLLLALYQPFYHLLGKIVDTRIRDILEGRPYPDAPPSCFAQPVNNLILGHFHIPRDEEVGKGKRVYNISSPRVHVDGVQDGVLVTHRDNSYLVISSGKDIRMMNQRDTRRIQIAAYFPHSSPR